MAFDRETLLRVAKLARISLSEEEVQELLPQFDEIFGLLEEVKSIPTAEDSITIVENENELRKDVVAPFERPEEIQAQFPEKDGAFARVPPNL